ncbi:hypothetical protein HHI36_007982 [Cryptolaemus montrouzieri]|uniref:SAM-dependent MTase RsmB/NOP-type domain-containing protein n=1 Tax=Cryptolaemus montrouzieri TaxID=559131 RepID=A0ABD2MR74_9CUCU
MPYPNSPFSLQLHESLMSRIESASSYSSSINISNFTRICNWLCTPPRVTTIRVNTLLSNTDNILNKLHHHFRYILEDALVPNIYIHESTKDVIIVEHTPKILDNISPKEIIVDDACAAAVLRGAHIFAPGVLGMTIGCQKSDNVSIYVDLAKKCKKGLQKVYDKDKILIAKGVVNMTRSELYGENLNPQGIAITITETISGCPQIPEDLFPKGSALLQNLPSVICIHSLNPLPNEVILDMCAAPGHKTSHIAALMNNQGTLVAIDKNPGRIKKLRKHCSDFNINARIFLSNSTLIFNESSQNRVEDGPPFLSESFDRILLDAPCSALGKRPQFRNDITEKVLLSFVPLQKKLFIQAVNLLKINGCLVYSTCTITLDENEGIVAWALKKFNNLRLVKSKLHIGSPGLGGTTLSTEDLQLLQRFGPNDDSDSIGFFIACFIKK